MDQGVRLLEVDGEFDVKISEISAVAEFVGHRSTVERFSVYSSSGRILSAGIDSLVGLLTTDISEAAKAPNDATALKAKRRKESSARPPRYGSLRMLQGHTSPVSGVALDPKDSILEWDIPSPATTLSAPRTLPHTLW